MSRKLLLSHLQTFSHHRKVDLTITSYEGGIYQVFMTKGKTEALIWKNDHTPLKGHSLGEMRELLSDVHMNSLILRQDSAYDEMIGQQQRAGANTLTVPLDHHTNSPSERRA